MYRTSGDDECLAGGVDVGLRPWQHPHARNLNVEEDSELVLCKIQGTAIQDGTMNRKREMEPTVGIAEAMVATAAALAPARVASADTHTYTCMVSTSVSSERINGEFIREAQITTSELRRL